MDVGYSPWPTLDCEADWQTRSSAQVASKERTRTWGTGREVFVSAPRASSTGSGWGGGGGGGGFSGGGFGGGGGSAF